MKTSVIFSYLGAFLAMQLSLMGGEETDKIRVPIEYRGVLVSIEIPRRSAARATFPSSINPVPSDLKAVMDRSGEYVLWYKDWSWSRSWFRGPLGHMIFDARLNLRKIPRNSSPKDLEHVRRANFLNPEELLAYIRTMWSDTVGAEFSQYSLVKRDGVIWVRCYESKKIFKGVPTSENWLLGITEDIFLIFDFGVVRDSKGTDGERWQNAALYWQNRIIDSIKVSGLKQMTTGLETVVTWEFPKVLQEPKGTIRADR